MVATFFEMCIGHSLVASYSDPNFFSSLFGGLENLVLSFLFEYTNWSFHRDFTNNSIVVSCYHINTNIYRSH